MGRYFLTQRAVDDLVGIFDFIAADNPLAAAEHDEALHQKFQILADNPLIGRLHIRLREKPRSFPMGRYVIFYILSDRGVEIIRVLHGSRDLPRCLGEPDPS